MPNRSVAVARHRNFPKSIHCFLHVLSQLLFVQAHLPSSIPAPSVRTSQSLPTPPPAGATQQQDEASTEKSSAREAENEASKAQRMLSLAGIRVASGAQDGASALPNSIAQHHQPPSSASSLLLNPNGVSPAKRRSSRGGAGAIPRGPPRFSVLRFLASMEGGGVTPAAATPPAPAEGGAAATTATAGGAVSFGRGDLVEFTVVARRGQRQQSQRVGSVSLLSKAGLPCR